ncbi:outer membrane protein assembly factor BamE domain-containing protein [Candidatus Pelagibacter communis]|uniref:outer membrane protein assembly factor BamE domain-containing protein n=1 Tax=Pelagibacter ubique TaxID=198252 RepID=UPI0021D31B63|nr:outer membrane protein assembly factor BamE [Candidatus Pelagibacter ubique]
MNKILYITFFLLIVSNCSTKPVIKHHGIHFLEKKQNDLKVKTSNTNDILKILGNPSTRSKFDNDVWIYIERKKTQSRIKNLGRMKIIENNVLVLEINKYGILEKKIFYDKNKMEELKIAEYSTKSGFDKETFIYSFMSSMRQKLNDPLGTRAKKRESISQR